MKFRLFYNVIPKERDLTQPLEKDMEMILRPCYIVVDRDGDFVDASSGRLPPSSLDHVLQRVNREFPQNAPFRVIKWTGREFIEMGPVS